MSKVMLVNVTHVEESRVAVLQDGVLDAYEIETINRTQIKGNIYNALVENVHPTLEAAFLKISPDLKGFLPLDEVNFNLLPARSDSRKAGKIGQHLHPGQKIMAQVVREPFAGKPPTVSTYFSLPGRFLVLMPGVDSAGVSRKIEDAEQRERLRKIVSDLKPPEGFGLIVRTAGMGQTKAELQRDLRYLLRLWQSIQRASKATEFPGLVYREADLVIRTMRDHLSSDIGEVWIDSKDTYDRALDFVRDVMPNRAKTLRLYSAARPLFNKYNLEEQIETIYKRRAPLPSGGEIVIDGTEALTAIDVNSARSKRKGDAEESILQTNLEAAAEIARQLRLRDLAGLIVVDFIDMAPTRNKKKVEDAMRDALRSDRARHDVTRISKLGLMEIARQRLRGEKMRATYTSCPTCEGYGLIKNPEAAALAALRKLQTRGSRGDVGRVRASVPPEIATWILNQKRQDLLNTEQGQNLRIEIEPDARLLRHECKLETFPRETVEAPAARVVGDRQPAPPPPEDADVPSAPPSTDDARAEPTAAPESSPPRKRRRRRRRGGQTSDQEPGAPPEDTPRDTEESPKVVPFAARPTEPTPPADEAAAGAEGTETDRPDAGAADPERAESDAADASTAPAGSGAAETDTEATTGDITRRKRRRRRRGRGGSDPAAPGASQESADSRTDPPVPRGVRSDELMPAASGARRDTGRGSPRGGRRRRKPVSGGSKTENEN